MERAQFIVFQDSNTMTIGSDGELDGYRSQIGQYRLELRMHTVLTCAQIHRANGQPLHHGFHLIERKTVGANWIAVAESARQIALVGQSESEAKSRHQGQSHEMRMMKAVM